MTIDKNHMPQV